MKGAAMMNHNRSEQENLIQLQQLVLHLQSELNKYKTSQPPTKSELEYEQEKLLDSYKELLYKSNKQQRKIDLYKKQFKNLLRQRDEANYVVKNLKDMQESLNFDKYQLNETLFSFKEDLLKEIKHALNKKNEKIVKFTRNFNEINKQETNSPKKKIKDPHFTANAEEILNINMRQKELITVLEDFVMHLAKNKN
ncbi:hypothetical protein [Sporosarcina sp. SAFN-010]|uniref:hypothetical protein n=1 Tax=Sporosarcina sp. SAFN-010 TaxID=3387273 RepID=UPI003F8075FC